MDLKVPLSRYQGTRYIRRTKMGSTKYCGSLKHDLRRNVIREETPFVGKKINFLLHILKVYTFKYMSLNFHEEIQKVISDYLRLRRGNKN